MDTVQLLKEMQTQNDRYKFICDVDPDIVHHHEQLKAQFDDVSK